MIALQHDFFNNFSQGVACDNELTYDLLVDELSSILAYHKDRLVNLLNTQGGQKLTIKSTNDEILDTIINSYSNSKIIRGVCYLIAETNYLINAKTNHQTAVRIIEKIYSGVNPIIQSMAGNNSKKDAFKSKIISLLNVKNTKGEKLEEAISSADATTDESKKWSKKKKIIVFSILGAVVIGGSILTWWLIKRSKESAMMGDGSLPSFQEGGDTSIPQGTNQPIQPMQPMQPMQNGTGLPVPQGANQPMQPQMSQAEMNEIARRAAIEHEFKGVV